MGGKLPDPVTKQDQYLLEIIGLLRAIEENTRKPVLEYQPPKPKPKPAPKKG